MKFDIIDKNHDTINPFADDYRIKKIISIARGLYSIEKNGGSLILNDLRYGSRTLGIGKNEFMFSYTIKNDDGRIQITRRSFGKLRLDMLPLLLRRMLGDVKSG
jgi:inner membrane protein